MRKYKLTYLDANGFNPPRLTSIVIERSAQIDEVSASAIRFGVIHNECKSVVMPGAMISLDIVEEKTEEQPLCV